MLIIQHYNERNAFFSTLHLIVSSLGYFHSFSTCQICSYDCSLIATLLLKVLRYLGIISVSLNLFLMYTSNALVQNIMMSWLGKKYATPPPLTAPRSSPYMLKVEINICIWMGFTFIICSIPCSSSASVIS